MILAILHPAVRILNATMVFVHVYPNTRAIRTPVADLNAYLIQTVNAIALVYEINVLILAPALVHQMLCVASSITYQSVHVRKECLATLLYNALRYHVNINDFTIRSINFLQNYISSNFSAR